MKAPIAVIQSSFLGDCILSLPFLFHLGRIYPDRKIILICDQRGKSVFEEAQKEGLSHLDLDVVLFDKRNKDQGPMGMWRFCRELRQNYPLPASCFLLQRSFRSALLALLWGIKERIGFGSGSASFLYTKAHARSWENGVAELEKNLNLLREEGHQVEPWNPKNAPSLLGGKKLRTLKQTRIALSFASPWQTKRWDLKQAGNLVEMLSLRGYEIVLMGDRSYQSEALELEKSALRADLVENLVGKTSIQEWIQQMKGVDALVSGDSAAVHLACDLGIPVVALFGPTVVDFGFAPWRRQAMALWVDLDCRPCHIHGPSTCPLGHHDCMKKLDAQTVERALRGLLSES